MNSFSVIIKDENDYMYERGKYQILSEENDVNMQFETKGQLIGFMVDNLD